MTNLPPLPSVIFGKSLSTVVCAAAFATRLRSRAAEVESDSDAGTASMSMRAYQTSSARVFEYSAIRSRYERTHVDTASRWFAAENPLERPACTKLAASRLTSHS